MELLEGERLGLGIIHSLEYHAARLSQQTCLYNGELVKETLMINIIAVNFKSTKAIEGYNSSAIGIGAVTNS